MKKIVFLLSISVFVVFYIAAQNSNQNSNQVSSTGSANQNQKKEIPPIKVNFTDKIELEKLKEEEAFKAFSNHRLISGLVGVNEESDKRNHRYFELLWFVQEDVYQSKVLLPKPFQLTKRFMLDAYWLRKMTANEKEKILAAQKASSGSPLNKSNSATDSAKGDAGSTSTGDAASSNTTRSTRSSSTASSGSSGAGSSGGAGGSGGAGSSGSGGSGGSNNFGNEIKKETPTVNSITYQSCENSVDYDSWPGSVSVRQKQVTTYSDGSVKRGACEVIKSYPIKFETSSCSAKPDFQKKVAVEYGKKTYFNNVSVVELTGCVPSANEFPLLSEKSNCVDDYNSVTKEVEYKRKFYYVKDGFKTYISECLLTSQSGQFNGPILEEYSSSVRVDQAQGIAIEQYKRYVEVDGKKYYIDSNYVDANRSWPIFYNQNVCGESYYLDNVQKIAYYQKQLGYSKDGSWKALGSCEPDDTRGFKLIVDQSTCGISIRNSDSFGKGNTSIVLKKRTYFEDDDGKIVVVSNCTETNDIISILESDVERDYSSCKDTLEPNEGKAIANYVRSVTYNGKKYSLSQCIKSIDPFDMFYFQKETSGCSPKLDIQDSKAYETAYSYYYKGGIEVKVSDCSLTGNSFELKKSTNGCSKGLSPDGLNFIINVYYYYNTATGPVSLTGCQQDTSQGYVPIVEKDIIKNYDECSFYLDKQPGQLFITDLRKETLYPQYTSYVDLGNNVVRIAGCKPDKNSFQQKPIISYDSCKPAIFADANAKQEVGFENGYVSPQVNVSYVDTQGVKRVFLNCIATKDKFKIKEEVLGCKPSVVNPNVDNPVYIVMVQQYYIDAEDQVKYLEDCKPQIVNGAMNTQYLVEEFCGVDPNDPNDTDGRFEIDLDSNVVYYKTRWVYHDVDGVKTLNELSDCKKSFKKTIRLLKEDLCGYQHFDSEFFSKIWIRKVFAIDKDDALAYDQDRGKKFFISGYAGSSLKVMPLTAKESAKTYSIAGMIDDDKNKQDEASAYMNQNCLPTVSNHSYIKQANVDKNTTIDLDVYAFSLKPDSSEYNNAFNFNAFHDDFLVASYQWPSMKREDHNNTFVDQQGLDSQDFSNITSGLAPIALKTFSGPIPYFSHRFSALKFYLKTSYKEDFSRIDGSVFQTVKNYVNLGKIGINLNKINNLDKLLNIEFEKTQTNEQKNITYGALGIVVNKPIFQSFRCYYVKDVVPYGTDDVLASIDGDIGNALREKRMFLLDYYRKCPPVQIKRSSTQAFDLFGHYHAAHYSVLPYLSSAVNPGKGSSENNCVAYWGGKMNYEESWERNHFITDRNGMGLTMPCVEFKLSNVRDNLSVISDTAVGNLLESLRKLEPSLSSSELYKVFAERFNVVYSKKDIKISNYEQNLNYTFYEELLNPSFTAKPIVVESSLYDCTNIDSQTVLDKKVTGLCQ